MVDPKETSATASAQTVAKKNRRGVNNQTKAVAQLRFHEKDAAQNMLFVGHLAEVRVDYSNNAEAKQFAGMNVPRVTLHFASNHTNVSEQRHVYKTLNPVESNVNTIPGGSDEWKVVNVFNWMKHVLDIYYLKGRELTDSEEEALSLPFEDFDDNNDYVNVEPEEVIAGYAFIFNNFVAMMTGTWNLKDGEVAKPVFKTADGKIIPTWLKLLRHKKRKNKWTNVDANGELAFDNFIGNGAIEIIKRDTPPAVLRVDLAKESITPKEVNQQPTIGGIANSMVGLGGITVGPSEMTTSPINSAFADAASDMPF